MSLGACWRRTRDTKEDVRLGRVRFKPGISMKLMVMLQVVDDRIRVHAGWGHI